MLLIGDNRLSKLHQRSKRRAWRYWRRILYLYRGKADTIQDMKDNIAYDTNLLRLIRGRQL